jgi:hypothetical protein
MTAKRKIWKFRYEKWSEPTDGIAGTIRTIPENYYVATVKVGGRLDFSDRMEVNTRRIHKDTIRGWWANRKNGRK